MFKFKNFSIIILALIFIFVFSSDIFAAKGEENLPNKIKIHLGDDGLVKLTDGKVDNMAPWRVFINRYKKFVVGFAAFGAATMLFFFIRNFMKLALVDNAEKRKEVLMGIWMTGIATASLGAIGIITALFYNVF